MALEITIKEVPEDVYARLSARAALEQKSLEVYLQEELRRLAQPSPNEEWAEKARKLTEEQATRVPSELIVQMLREDRR